MQNDNVVEEYQPKKRGFFETMWRNMKYDWHAMQRRRQFRRNYNPGFWDRIKGGLQMSNRRHGHRQSAWVSLKAQVAHFHEFLRAVRLDSPKSFWNGLLDDLAPLIGPRHIHQRDYKAKEKTSKKSRKMSVADAEATGVKQEKAKKEKKPEVDEEFSLMMKRNPELAELVLEKERALEEARKNRKWTISEMLKTLIGMSELDKVDDMYNQKFDALFKKQAAEKGEPEETYLEDEIADYLKAKARGAFRRVKNGLHKIFQRKQKAEQPIAKEKTQSAWSRSIAWMKNLWHSMVEGVRNSWNRTYTRAKNTRQHILEGVQDRWNKVGMHMKNAWHRVTSIKMPHLFKRKENVKEESVDTTEDKPGLWQRFQYWLSPFKVPEYKSADEAAKELGPYEYTEPTRWQKIKNWLSPFKIPEYKSADEAAKELGPYEYTEPTKWQKFKNWLSPFKYESIYDAAKEESADEDKPTKWHKFLGWVASFKKSSETKTSEAVIAPVAAVEYAEPVNKPFMWSVPEKIETEPVVSKDGVHLTQTVYYPKTNMIHIYDTDYSKGINSKRGLDSLVVVDLDKKLKITKRKLGGTQGYDAGVKETLSVNELRYYGNALSDAAQDRGALALSAKDISTHASTGLPRWTQPVAVENKDALAEKREAILANKDAFVADEWTTEQAPDLGKLGKPSKVLAVLNPLVDSMRHRENLTDIEMGEMSMMCRLINGYGAESRTFSYLNRLISDKFQLDVARALADRLKGEGIIIPTRARSVRNNYDSQAEIARWRSELEGNNRQNRTTFEALHRANDDYAVSPNVAGMLAYKYVAEKNARNRGY